MHISYRYSGSIGSAMSDRNHLQRSPDGSDVHHGGIASYFHGICFRGGVQRRAPIAFAGYDRCISRGSSVSHTPHRHELFASSS